MKKFVSTLMMALLLVGSLTACGTASESTGKTGGSTVTPTEKITDAASVDKVSGESTVEPSTDDKVTMGDNSYKVGIVTNTVSQNEEEYRSAQAMVEKYGKDRIVHVTWPDNFITEQEQMITTVTKLGADPDIKAIIINQAVAGTNAAVDKLKETRDDIFIIYGTPAENPEDIATRADLLLQPNELDMGPAMVEQAKKLGAKTFVHYSFPRHMSMVLLSQRRDLIKQSCIEAGLEFVDATAPDPTGESGIPGAQQYILEDVPKMVEKYGADTAFFSTNCSMQVPLIKACVDLKAIYPQPCCPSPFHGYPAALGLISEEKGDSAIVLGTQYIIDQTTAKLKEAGCLGRFSTWPVPVSMMITVAGTEYAFQVINGNVSADALDLSELGRLMENYAGVKIDMTSYTDKNGKVYDNYKFIMMDFLTYQ